MNKELREAAERLTGDGEAYGYDRMRVQRMLVDAIALARAYLAEHPADEDEQCDEAWLYQARSGRTESCPWKRYALLIGAAFGLTIGWCPPMGDSPSCICINEVVHIVNPTRGQVCRLAAALGVALKEEWRSA